MATQQIMKLDCEICILTNPCPTNPNTGKIRQINEGLVALGQL